MTDGKLSPDQLTVSLKEAFGLLKLEDTIDLNYILKSQIDAIKYYVEQHKVNQAMPTQSLCFIIPLDAYIPLPYLYTASLVRAVKEGAEGSDSYESVSIASYELELKVKEQVSPLKMSFAIATVAKGNYDFSSIVDIPKLHEIYNEALSATSAVISAYKMTPGRHNHFLQPVTALGSPGNVHIVLYDVASKSILEKKTIMLHEHVIVDAWESRQMTDIERKNFYNIHVSMGFKWTMPLWLASKVNEAVDARCVGKDNSAVILADHYAELTMRYILFELLIARGLTATSAKATLKSQRTIDLLVNNLAKEFNYSSTQFKNIIKYSVWKKECRKRRNGLSHEVTIVRITPQESFKALDSSLEMINKMCELVNKKYPSALQDTQWLMSMHDVTKAMKRGRNKKKGGPISHGDSPYNPDINYESLSKSSQVI